MTETLPLSKTEGLIFFRPEGFYFVQAVEGIPLAQQAEEHASLNPGTQRIEDIRGGVLWQIQ